MDREIWTALRMSVKRVCRAFKTTGREPQFPNLQIALMYFWSVWQGGCLGWACDRIHYGDLPPAKAAQRQPVSPTCE